MTDSTHSTPSPDLVAVFDGERPRLRSIAVRMLGTTHEADDVMQEAWIRVQRSDLVVVDNVPGWLTTVVARLCLDVLRTRSRRAEMGLVDTTEPVEVAPLDPAAEWELAEAVGTSLTVVLETLRPDERLAFVLHDLFAVPFDAIGPILGRSASATKQLASRARARVRGGSPSGRADAAAQQCVVAFLEAARGGDLHRLITLLHPDVEIDADEVAVRMGSPARTVGADAVAATFNGRAQGAQWAWVEGRSGFAWFVGERPKVVWEATVEDDRIVHIEMLADPALLEHLDIVT
jgi:RNA polymerase sigma factor (sigma-70 family)